MSAILVSQFGIPDCQFNGSTGFLRLYADGDWTDSLGVPHELGAVRSNNTFYQEIPCTLANKLLTVPPFTTYSTVDAQFNNAVLITAEIFDQTKAWKKTFFKDFFIPSSPLTTTWSLLNIANQGRALFLPPLTYVDIFTVQQYINQQTKIPAKATVSMVNGVATVALTIITLSSVVLAASMDPNVSGALNVTLNPGVGFTINSTNLGDNGVVGFVVL